MNKQIIVIDREHNRHTFEFTEGQTIASVIKTNLSPGNYMMCGGCCSCATCHVYVDQAWISKLQPMDEDESDLLYEDHVNEYSRLGCQVVLTDELDGIEVKIA